MFHSLGGADAPAGPFPEGIVSRSCGCTGFPLAGVEREFFLDFAGADVVDGDVQFAAFLAAAGDLHAAFDDRREFFRILPPRASADELGPSAVLGRGVVAVGVHVGGDDQLAFRFLQQGRP